MAESTPLVRIEGLYKSFGSLDVLKGIDLNVQQGQKISLIGPSGSGKTTLLRCVNYLEEPTKGDIYIDNELIGQRLVGTRKVPMSDKELARMRTEIGMVFQRFNLFPHLSVLDNIILGPLKVQQRSRAEAVELAEDLLNKVGMFAKA
jgi:ABC-type polar amino acid transport system, ATPase component